MVTKKDFEEMQRELEEREHERDAIVAISRELVKLSKRVIYAVHRHELGTAKALVKEMKARLANLEKAAEKTPELYYTGSFKIAVQEYVEAICYYELITTRHIPSAAALKVDTEYYLLGICDLTGELVRKAINAAIKGDFEQALFIKQFVTDLYDELMLFEFRNELRKKFDSIKYDLKKLDELALDITLKGHGR